MLLLKQILPAALVALTVAAAVCGLAFFWNNKRARGPIVSFAIALGYWSGHLIATGWVPFPPADTTNWLPYFALVAALLGALSALVSARTWARMLILAVTCAGAWRVLLKPKFQYAWSAGEGWLWVAGLACALLLFTAILDVVARRTVTAAELPAFLLMISAGTFGVLMLSGSLLLGQFALILSAALLGAGVFAVRGINLGREIVPVFALLLGALLLSGYFFAELPAMSAMLIAFAPALALISIRMPTLRAFLLRAALISVPILVALIVAFRSSPSLSY